MLRANMCLARARYKNDSACAKCNTSVHVVIATRRRSRAKCQPSPRALSTNAGVRAQRSVPARAIMCIPPLPPRITIASPPPPTPSHSPQPPHQPVCSTMSTLSPHAPHYLPSTSVCDSACVPPPQPPPPSILIISSIANCTPPPTAPPRHPMRRMFCMRCGRRTSPIPISVDVHPRGGSLRTLCAAAHALSMLACVKHVGAHVCKHMEALCVLNTQRIARALLAQEFVVAGYVGTPRGS